MFFSGPRINGEPSDPASHAHIKPSTTVSACASPRLRIPTCRNLLTSARRPSCDASRDVSELFQSESSECLLTVNPTFEKKETCEWHRPGKFVESDLHWLALQQILAGSSSGRLGEGRRGERRAQPQRRVFVKCWLPHCVDILLRGIRDTPRSRGTIFLSC